jgi:deoxyribodipyrimidine photo-lyase
VRRWVPEIAKLPEKFIHCPWQADFATLKAAGIRLDETYPRPIVDHAAARISALAAFEGVKSGRPKP